MGTMSGKEVGLPLGTRTAQVKPWADRFAEEKDRFTARSNFPNRESTWESFIAGYQGVSVDMPFAMTLQKVPEQNIAHVLVPTSTPVEHVFFGILSGVHERRLGRFCFGPESKDFGDRREEGGFPSFFLRENGFDAGFLKVVTEGRSFRYGENYKVIAMDVMYESVQTKLAGALNRFCGDVRTCPRDAEAFALAKVRRIMFVFLPLCARFGKTERLEDSLKIINMRIESSRSRMLYELERLRESVFQKECDINYLVRGTLDETRECPNVP